jgi:phosphatidylinositol-3-phosphatase
MTTVDLSVLGQFGRALALTVAAIVSVLAGAPARAPARAPSRASAALPAGTPAAIPAAATAGTPHHSPATVPATWAHPATAQVRHVFVIVLENESASVTFGPASPAPYLSKTLPSLGAYLPNYYGVGHHSLDNYIAMISGQAPNIQTQADCDVFGNFPGGSLGPHGQEPGTGCIYPADVLTIASQLTAARLTWRDYNEDMGADPAREAAVCGHPAVGSPDNTEVATPTDMYATRHNPFVYFHSIIDDASLCDSHVVNLNLLGADLRRVSATRNYTFITPDLCDDGHDSRCANGQPGGLAQANAFLRTWVPRITASPAFRQDGLLIVTFDEADTSDASTCCGTIAGPGAAQPGETGPGGGDVGAVLLSPCIAPGTVSQTAYNHYTMLGSVENIFGLGHLGYAGLPHETYFGTDIFKRGCGPAPPVVRFGTARFRPAGGSRLRIRLRWTASTRGGTALAYYQLQERRGGRWITVADRTHGAAYAFTGTVNRSYPFRVRGVNVASQAGRWAATTVASAT